MLHYKYPIGNKVKFGGIGMNNQRNWTVLLIGGPSGTGKSSIAYRMAEHYGVNVLEIDDVYIAVKTASTKKDFPAVHYWDSDVDWMDIEVLGNVNWLTDVGKEMMPVLKEIVNRHLEDRIPIIIEGDFIHSELAKSFQSSEVKSIFVIEKDSNQIVENYFHREGGDPQTYRAQISIEYGKKIQEYCEKNDLKVIDSRPFDTVLERVVEYINK